MEIWKDIKGYEGMYQISSYGRVYSKPRKTKTRGVEGHFLKQRMVCGYCHVCLCCSPNKKKFVRVHKLVALHFLPNPQKFPIINHKDENKLNNNVDNLEWCTYSYNASYATIRKRKSIAMRNHPDIKKRKIPVISVNIKTGETKWYDSLSQAGKAHGVWASRIKYNIEHNYQIKGYRFRYAPLPSPEEDCFL